MDDKLVPPEFGLISIVNHVKPKFDKAVRKLLLFDIKKMNDGRIFSTVATSGAIP
jgi:hypothetical protein